MNSIQIHFGLVCSVLLVMAGLWLASIGFADWGLLAVGTLLLIVSGVSWWRERSQGLITLPARITTAQQQ